MEKEKQINYAPNYKIKDGCLCEIKHNKQGEYDKKLCNFTPWIVSEITVDDGVETSTRIRLAGVHESGRTLPEIEIAAEELGNFNWLHKHWGIDCILETGPGVKDSIRYAIQTTAPEAERQTVYTVTGWKRISGQYHFLMPGDSERTVSLAGKMQGYTMERRLEENDIGFLEDLLLTSHLAPPEILLTLLAFAFLTPLNHFLKLAGCEPKFVVFLTGKTGSRKSSLAALIQSFFGRFTGTELPLSFRDTLNSILHHTFALKDVLTCIDDFHPAGRQEETKLTASAQGIMRAYGDRSGRGRLRADASPMDARPPQGNAIITGEFPPDIGESGTARYFGLELHDGDVNLNELTFYQHRAAEGVLQRCMYGYLEWLKEYFLHSDETEANFILFLKSDFEAKRTAFQKSGIHCHGRVPEAVALLQIGMDMLLAYLELKGELEKELCDEVKQRFQTLLYQLATEQAENIIQDKPTHKFIRKFYALLESGKVCVLDKNRPCDFISQSCVGYEDDEFFYLHSEVIHKEVRKLCDEQGESFTISQKSLLKALAEEGFIETASGQNTKQVRIGKKKMRLLCIRKNMVQQITDAA